MKLLMEMKWELLMKSFQYLINGVHLLFIHGWVWVEGNLTGLLSRVHSVECRAHSSSSGHDRFGLGFENWTYIWARGVMGSRHLPLNSGFDRWGLGVTFVYFFRNLVKIATLLIEIDYFWIIWYCWVAFGWILAERKCILKEKQFWSIDLDKLR